MYKRALISVSNKEGIIPFAEQLIKRGFSIVSSGGTAKTLSSHGIAVTKVADVTGAPEILGGRVKTLHPKIHGGILGRPGLAEDDADMNAEGIEAFGLVVVNLYPFAQTLLNQADKDTIIENIDIGGPAMVRAAAKNHHHVAIVVDPNDYNDLLEAFDQSQGNINQALRTKLARKAFAHTAAYDSMVAQWFAKELQEVHGETVNISGELVQPLRYGENPHQEAAFYRNPLSHSGLAHAKQLHGKELSYNNINDADGAWALLEDIRDMAPFACAIIKHAQPCGAALGENPLEAFSMALRSDPVSAFGGIIALSGQVDGPTAEAIGELFAEIVMADGFDENALSILQQKKNLRLLVMPPSDQKATMQFKTVSGGFLVQSADTTRITERDLTCKTSDEAAQQDLTDLAFAFRVVKHVTSNGIVLVRDRATVGIGGGQTNRVDAVDLAIRRAQKASELANHETSFAQGACLASDAFFPFPDNIERLAEAGVKTVVQPVGSMRDQEVFARAEELGVTIYAAPSRHFKH